MKVPGIRERGGWYYARIRGKEYALKAKVGQEVEAVLEMGRIKERLEKGENIAGARKKVGDLKYPKKDERGKRIWEMHLQPFFKGHRIHEIDAETIEAYIQKRWDGEPTSTIDREFQALRAVIQDVQPGWGIPKSDYQIKDPRYKDAIDQEVIYAAADTLKLMNAPEVEWIAFWIMAYTGIEPMDCEQLAWCHFKNNILVKVRSKTRHHKKNRMIIRVPVIPKLAELLKKCVRSIDPNQPILHGLKRKNLSTNVKRAFDVVLYPGKTTGQMAKLRKEEGLEKYPSYGTKDVRRHVVTALSLAGVKPAIIQTVAAHVEGSKVTKDYIRLPEKKLIDMFERAL